MLQEDFFSFEQQAFLEDLEQELFSLDLQQDFSFLEHSFFSALEHFLAQASFSSLEHFDFSLLHAGFAKDFSHFFSENLKVSRPSND